MNITSTKTQNYTTFMAMVFTIFATSYLSNLYSLSNICYSIIFPSIGIAGALTFLYGMRAMVASIIGLTLYYFFNGLGEIETHSIMRTASSLAILVPIILFLGLGCYLTRKKELDYDSLINSKGVINFFLYKIIGPAIIVAIIPSLTCDDNYLVHTISVFSSLVFNTLVFLPLTLMILKINMSIVEKQVKNLLITLFLIFGSLGYAYYYKYSHEYKAKSVFNDKSDYITTLIAYEVNHTIEIGRSIEALFLSSNWVDHDEFDTFVSTLEKKKSITSISWLPYVKGREFGKFLEYAKKEHGDNVELINNFTKRKRGAYLPVMYAWPSEIETKFFGLDHYDEIDENIGFKKILEINDESVAVVKESSKKRNDLYVYLPIYKASKFLGVVSVSYDINMFFDEFLKGLAYHGVELQVFNGDKLVYNTATNLSVGYTFSWKSHIGFTNKGFEVLALYNLSTYYAVYAKDIYSYLLLTMIFLSLGVFSLYILNRSNEQIIKVVNNRTEELNTKNATLLQLSQAKSEFVANMSHEIRTPLNGILGIADVAISETKDAKIQEYLATIQSCGRTLIDIIGNILDFSKIDSGKLEIKNEPFNLEKMTYQIKSLFVSSAELKNIALNVVLPKNLPSVVIGDETRIKQILSNLVSNALKFTEEGEVKIIVEYINHEDDNCHISFIVEDTGVGIDWKDQKNLFKKFEQVDSSLQKKYSGTGLGLAISKKLCELMNGDIWLKSGVGVGSTFTFSIPLKIEKNNIQINHNKMRDLTNFSEHRLKVLLAEDNKVNQTVARKFLEKMGITEVDIANNGEEAIDLVLKNKYDFFLMDLQMPICDGLEATERIRDKARNGGPYIIALTASVAKEDQELCLEAGMDDFLSKPLKAKALAQAVEIYLQDIDIDLETEAS